MFSELPRVADPTGVVVKADGMEISKILKMLSVPTVYKYRPDTIKSVTLGTAAVATSTGVFGFAMLKILILNSSTSMQLLTRKNKSSMRQKRISIL